MKPSRLIAWRSLFLIWAATCVRYRAPDSSAARAGAFCTGTAREAGWKPSLCHQENAFIGMEQPEIKTHLSTAAFAPEFQTMISKVCLCQGFAEGKRGRSGGGSEELLTRLNSWNLPLAAPPAPALALTWTNFCSRVILQLPYLNRNCLPSFANASLKL